ncbi:MAG: hypothetical protein KKE16_03115 [Firmicutes bacterium]|nr:hypothetical protein [Bacillota bacterium]
MNKIKHFVSKLLKDFFNQDDKKELIEILTLSLEEKVEDLVEQGTPVDEAIEKSIKEFGNTDDILNAYPEKQKKQKALLQARRSQFFFALFGYILIVGLAVFFNLTFFDFFGGKYWFVVVAIGVFFWPLVMLYHLIRQSK